MPGASPLDDFRALIGSLPDGDEEAAGRVRSVFDHSEKPKRSLGRIEDIAAWLARWSGRMPAVNRPLVAIFAGNHGVLRHGVSPRPQSATQRAVELCAAGGAAVNQICLAHDLGLKVFDLALDLPTADITDAPALDPRACAATMAFGMEAVAGGTDLLCVGDIGAGGSTAAAAVLCALHGGRGADWVGPGSGADPAMRERKAQVVDRAVWFHRDHLGDPLEVLCRLGGREFAAIAGAILAARFQKVPVVLDGFTAAAAASVLHALDPRALDHCIAAQRSVEPGHAAALERTGMAPLLDLGFGEAEGAGAALAGGMVKAAALTMSGLAAALAAGRA